jgi:hypothetical protein
MPDDTSVSLSVARRRLDDALQQGPRKKPYLHPAPCLALLLMLSWMIDYYRCLSDPLISHGRHFGRTVHALCNVQTLLTNGLVRMDELADEPEETSTSEYVDHFEVRSATSPTVISLSRQKHERHIFEALLNMVPGLKERLTEATEDEVAFVAEMVSYECHAPATILCSMFWSYKRACLVPSQTTQKV